MSISSSDAERWLETVANESAEGTVVPGDLTNTVAFNPVSQSPNSLNSWANTTGFEAQSFNDQTLLAEVMQRLDRLGQQMEIQQNQPNIVQLQLPAQTSLIRESAPRPSPTGRILKFTAAAALVATVGVVGVRTLSVVKDRSSTAGNGSADGTDGTIPGVLPNGRNTGRGDIIFDPSNGLSTLTAGASQNQDANISGDNLFKSSVEIPEADMVGGVNPDGSLNPEALGFVAADTIFDFTLQGTQQIDIPACGGSVTGAAYVVKAHNGFGPLGDDAITNTFAELNKVEQIRMYQGLFNVGDQASLANAFKSSYIMFVIDKPDGKGSKYTEIGNITGCAEAANG